MKNGAIIFHDGMIRGIQACSMDRTSRTQGLEVVNTYPDGFRFVGIVGDAAYFEDNRTGIRLSAKSPYGGPGDALRVRETLIRGDEIPRGSPGSLSGHTILYRATRDRVPYKKGAEIGFDRWAIWQWPDRNVIPSIFMPRWACRLNIRILTLGVAKLQDITDKEAEREGVERSKFPMKYRDYARGDEYVTDNARQSYKGLWNSMNGTTFPWDLNPWVFIYEFKKEQEVHCNGIESCN